MKNNVESKALRKTMKIKKFNSEGHGKWIEFYNELFLQIKNNSKGSKISPEDIKKGYNETFRKI